MLIRKRISLLETKTAGSQNAAIAARALSVLDLTDLSEGCCEDHIEKLLQRATAPFGPVAAICVWPQFVSLCVHRLHERPIPVATVINFPKGSDYVERAIDDTGEALSDGATEIDLLMPYHAYLAGDEPITRSMIAEVKDMMPEGTILKVILETGAFPDQDTIAAATRLAIEEGADFIKTSTGLAKVSATPEAARTILETIKDMRAMCGLKVSGGIKTLAHAKTYLDLADEIMGKDWAAPKTFRFGSSTLYDALVAEIGGTPKHKDSDGPA